MRMLLREAHCVFVASYGFATAINTCVFQLFPYIIIHMYLKTVLMCELIVCVHLCLQTFCHKRLL